MLSGYLEPYYSHLSFPYLFCSTLPTLAPLLLFPYARNAPLIGSLFKPYALLTGTLFPHSAVTCPYFVLCWLVAILKFFSDHISWYPTGIHFSSSVVATTFVLRCFRYICLWLHSPTLFQDLIVSGTQQSRPYHFCNSPGYSQWNKLTLEMVSNAQGASRLWKHPYNQIRIPTSFLNSMKCLSPVLGS